MNTLKSNTAVVDGQGNRLPCPTVMILFNAADNEVEFTLPGIMSDAQWKTILDTADVGAADSRGLVPGAGSMLVKAHSMILLAEQSPPS